jgi:hypothetical protein
MVDYIHYFIRNIDGKKGGLIYPDEIEIINYSTIGNFYIIELSFQNIPINQHVKIL